MKRLWPIAVALILIAGLATFVVVAKQHRRDSSDAHIWNFGTFSPARACSRPPKFLRQMHIPQPVMIDLSQKHYTGIALRYGTNFTQVLHPKQWEQYAHFSTYTLDAVGNLYLVPTPYISIHPTTFTLQKKLFRLDTTTGRVSIFMTFDDVRPRPDNPYGLSAVTYDCKDQTLWVAAIDESSYRHPRGVIYHVDPVHRRILQRVEGFDALTLRMIHTHKGTFLLAGSARDNGLYAFDISAEKGLASTPHKILEIPNPNGRIRKISLQAKNQLELQTIPFSYSLVAQAAKEDRTHYLATWSSQKLAWKIEKKSK